jgi:hypothetical protein
MKKNDILNNIINTANKIIVDSETCKCCGNLNDDNAFLCVCCEKWFCSNCESELEFICVPCYNRDLIYRMNREE